MEDICNDLAAETDDLVSVLRTLTTSDWDRSTPAEGWTIRDQVSHLTFFDETGTLAATDADAFAASMKELMGLADPDAAGLARGRSISTNDVLEMFISRRTAMIEAFRPLDPKARLPWYGPAMGATSFATARLMETWAHGQDIVDTVGAARVPTARLKHVAHIGVRARAFAYVTNKRAMPDGDVAVTLTAPNGDVWRWNEGSAADNEVSGPALDFCLAVTQRRHVADTALQVRGPLANDWMPIAQAFAGAPGGGRQPGQFAESSR